jgi:dephospho-CoA kinase
LIILGLTGSIGMGKSTTAKMFADLGIPVHDSDATVHALYRGDAVPLIEAAFPGTTADGEVRRDELGKRVFGKREEIARLEAIVHPLVHQAKKQFLAKAREAGHPVVVLDIPLLFETGGDKHVDKVVVVTAPHGVQRDRVLARGVSEDRLEHIRARQLPDAEKRARADFVVDTSNGLEAAEAQVRAILAELGAIPGTSAVGD